MSKHSMVAALAGAASLVLITGAVPVAVAQPTGSQPQCFRPTDFSSWKATPDYRTLYLRVGVNRIYRLDMSDRCSALGGVDSHLVLKVRGSGMFCSAVDFDLSVGDSHGMDVPCIVSQMTQLSATEAAALPPEMKP